MELAVASDDAEGEYSALVDYVDTILSRQRDYSAKDLHSLKEFTNFLDTSHAQLLEDNPGRAVDKMRQWQEDWTDRRQNSALPKRFMPIALSLSEAVIDLYGEPLVYAAPFARRRNTDTARLIERTSLHLKSMETSGEKLLELLDDWNSLASRRP